MKKYIRTLFLLPLVSFSLFSAEEPPVDIEKTEAKLYPQEVAYDIKVPEYKPGLWLDPASLESKRFFTQTQLGFSSFVVNRITLGDESYRFHDGNRFLSLPKDQFGSGRYILTNLGYTLGTVFSATLGYYQGESSVSLRNQKAVNGNDQLIINMKETSQTQAVLTSGFYHPYTTTPLFGFSATPYLGVGTGLTFMQQHYEGEVVKSDRDSFHRVPLFLFGNKLEPKEQSTTYEVDNSTKFVKVPFIFDFGINLGTNPMKSPVCAVDAGLRLIAPMGSGREEVSSYLGLKLTF